MFKRPPLPTLKEAVTQLEDSVILLSGPALAISGILAGVDLLTGGSVLKNVPWLGLTWAICLLLTLDFQVLALGVRTRRIYASQQAVRRKVCEMAAAVAIAAGISFVSIQMQSIIARTNSAGVTIDQAAAQLGINTLALIWERSILVLVLIFMSGWFRDKEPAALPDALPTPAPVPGQPPDLEQLIERLDALYQGRLEAIIERTVERVTVSIEQQAASAKTVTEVPANPAFLPRSLTEAEQDGEPGGTAPGQRGNSDIDPDLDAASRLELAFQAMLAEGADITGNALYNRAGRKMRKDTAIKWLAARQVQP